jgi:hypothetical protein
MTFSVPVRSMVLSWMSLPKPLFGSKPGNDSLGATDAPKRLRTVFWYWRRVRRRSGVAPGSITSHDSGPPGGGPPEPPGPPPSSLPAPISPTHAASAPARTATETREMP